MIDKTLQGLSKGDVVEGGTFLQGLSDEKVSWTVTRPYDLHLGRMTVSAVWMGVSLGEFDLTKMGVSRVR